MKRGPELQNPAVPGLSSALTGLGLHQRLRSPNTRRGPREHAESQGLQRGRALCVPLVKYGRFARYREAVARLHSSSESHFDHPLMPQPFKVLQVLHLL